MTLEDTELSVPPRRRGRPAKAKVEAEVAPPPAEDAAPAVSALEEAGAFPVDEITYIPEDGDPVRTKWNGIEFKAYVPVKVSRRHTVQVLLRITQDMPDGTVVTKAVEKRIPMVELARNNARFSVNGKAPAKKAEAKARVPASPDEYRGYAINWIAQSTGASAMDARWENEQLLREKCGCDDADIAYLRPFFEARHEECSAATN